VRGRDLGKQVQGKFGGPPICWTGQIVWLGAGKISKPNRGGLGERQERRKKYKRKNSRELRKQERGRGFGIKLLFNSRAAPLRNVRELLTDRTLGLNLRYRDGLGRPGGKLKSLKKGRESYPKALHWTSTFLRTEGDSRWKSVEIN